MKVYEWFLASGLLTLVSCITAPTTTEDDALLVYTPLPDLQNSLRRHCVIPDLLRIGPEYALYLKYGNSSVTFGGKFTSEELKIAPTSLNWTCREDAFHTLVVVGLDVPTQKNHTEREWKHWLVVNIPANDIADGETIVPYEGPGLSYGKGPHRMVFMVYEQPWRNPISFAENAFADSPVRSKFDSCTFAEKYEIGDPVAANFLICETELAETKSTVQVLN